MLAKCGRNMIALETTYLDMSPRTTIEQQNLSLTLHAEKTDRQGDCKPIFLFSICSTNHDRSVLEMTASISRPYLSTDLFHHPRFQADPDTVSKVFPSGGCLAHRCILGMRAEIVSS